MEYNLIKRDLRNLTEGLNVWDLRDNTNYTQFESIRSNVACFCRHFSKDKQKTEADLEKYREVTSAVSALNHDRAHESHEEEEASDDFWYKGCEEYSKLQDVQFWVKKFLSVCISGSTIGFRFVIIFLIDKVGFHTETSRTKYTKIAVSWISIFNTGILIML